MMTRKKDIYNNKQTDTRSKAATVVYIVRVKMKCYD